MKINTSWSFMKFTFVTFCFFLYCINLKVIYNVALQCDLLYSRQLSSPNFVVFFFLCHSKSDFLIYKLKEIGKIDDKDIAMISDQFDQLGLAKCGKITLADIIGKL